MAKIDLKGKRFGRLTVIGVFGKNKNRELIWVCLCDCGQTKNIRGSSLRAGVTTSCGCYGKEQRKKACTKHGLSKHPIGAMYNSMIQRCTNPKNPYYKNYGGRGITVCLEWQKDKIKFFNWCKENHWGKELQLDRRDNDKGYCPSNCRFVSASKNIANKRPNAKNKNGFIGVNKHRDINRTKRFISTISYQKHIIFCEYFKTAEEAAVARDSFIVTNKLPHKLNFTESILLEGGNGQ